MQQSKVQLVPPAKNINWISDGRANSEIGYEYISPYQIFANEIFQKKQIPKKISVMVAHRPQWLVPDSCKVKIYQVFTPSLVSETHNAIRTP